MTSRGAAPQERYVRQPEGYTHSEQFKESFLRRPCPCCGSIKHSLLVVKELSRTRSGKIEFEYSCPVVEAESFSAISPYHPKDEINISFRFSTKKYAEMIKYDERVLMERFSELYESAAAKWFGESEDTVGHLDRVWNEILDMCLAHTREYEGETMESS